MKIVKNSAPPPPKGRKTKYPFSQLQPGDCLEIENQSFDDYHRIHSAFYGFRKRNDLLHWEVATRFNNNKVLIYRLADPVSNIKSKEKPEAVPAKKQFVPPSHDEATQYFEQYAVRDASAQAEKFINHYQSNGWKVGKNPMKDWKAAVRNWISNIKTYSNGNTAITTGNPAPTKLGTSAARMEAGKRWVETGSTKPAAGQDLFSK